MSEWRGGVLPDPVPVYPTWPGASAPLRCPAGHRLAIGGTATPRCQPYHRDVVLCLACHRLGRRRAAFALWDISRPRIEPADWRPGRAGLQLVLTPPARAQNPGRITLWLHDHAVGDIDMVLCGTCRVGVIEHVRVDYHRRRLGYGRLLVAAAQYRGRGYAWSTTSIERDNHQLASFWAAAGTADLQRGRPTYCRHTTPRNGHEADPRSLAQLLRVWNSTT
ncbi:hypothetical protein [Amycolatopsis suaedae]|uniref:hypothetical protein n=1 Tax=Amycolatopsis suaedae TaxID=2510978 RepID=UPI0013EF0F42|nr:hypothetical protein [Amycolatopsis suaedae]